MNKTTPKNIFVVLLLAVTILVVFMYILSLRKQVSVLEGQKERLAQALAEAKESEKKLSVLNSALKDNLSASNRKITELFAKNAAAQKSLEETSSRFSILQAENDALRVEKEKILAENENFKARLGIKAEFKKAIGELKKQVFKVGREIKEKSEEGKLTEGNRGYVIKDGKSTYPARVKIEVVPAAAQ